MDVGTSIAIIVLGLILRYVATDSMAGVSPHIAGLVVVIVGGIMLIGSLVGAASHEIRHHRRHHALS